MTQVRFAATADHLGPFCKEAVVGPGGDVFGCDWLPETGPAGARLKLVLKTEEIVVTADALVNALFMVVPQVAGEGPFGAFLAGDVVLLRR